MEKEVLFGADLGKSMLHVLRAPNGGAQDLEALRRRGQSPVADPNPVVAVSRLQLWEVARLVPSRIPDAGLTLVEFDARVASEGNAQGGIERVGAVRRRNDIDVEESKERFPGPHRGRGLLQRRVLGKRKQGRHERVALLPPFSLLNGVAGATRVPPEVGAVLAVEEAGVGEEGSKRRGAEKAAEHRLASDMIESADAVDRQHGSAGVELGRDPDGACEAFCSGFGAEGVLKGVARLLELG